MKVKIKQKHIDAAKIWRDKTEVNPTECCPISLALWDKFPWKNISVGWCSTPSNANKMFHEIFYISILDPDNDYKQIINTHDVVSDIEVLEHYYEFEVDRFAFHRPKKEYLNCYVELDNRINCYDKKFFHFFENKPESLEILYLADSNHKWKYGYPLDFDFSKINKLQLLTHPFSWSDSGGDNYGNFVTLIRERNDELVNSMNTETNTFPQELLS